MVILISRFLSCTILKGHLVDKLGHHFSRVIGVSENKITKTRSLDFNPTIPGYEFEYFPTPLAAGGVDMYFKSDLNYTVIAKSSEDASQALSISLTALISICGIICRQQNFPQRFQEYFDKTLETFSTANRSMFVMGDFNITLLGVETRRYTHNLFALFTELLSYFDC